MKIFLIALLSVISLLLGELVYDMRKVNKQRIAQIENLKDCRFELEIFLRRQRGEIEDPVHSINICHLDPLEEACSCARSRKDD